MPFFRVISKFASVAVVLSKLLPDWVRMLIRYVRVFAAQVNVEIFPGRVSQRVFVLELKILHMLFRIVVLY